MFNRRVLKDWLSETFLPIFLFHGIVEEDDYPIENHESKHLPRKDFQRMLYELKGAGGNALSLGEVLYYKESSDKRWPKRSFAITFDDGFESAYSLASHILEDMEIPATFFIVPNFIEGSSMDWSEQLDYCLSNIGKGTVNLPITERNIVLDSTSSKVGALIKIKEQLLSKEVRGGDLEEKHLFIEEYVRDVFSRNKMTYADSAESPLHNKMSWGQVKELSENPLFTIGGHGANHIPLAFLRRMDALKEINTCRNMIEDNTGEMIKYFSYPGGEDFHYNKEVVSLMTGCGIRACFNSEAKPNVIEIGNYDFRRVPVA